MLLIISGRGKSEAKSAYLRNMIRDPHFGLGKATKAHATEISEPSGLVQRRESVARDQFVKIREYIVSQNDSMKK